MELDTFDAYDSDEEGLPGDDAPIHLAQQPSFFDSFSANKSLYLRAGALVGLLLVVGVVVTALGFVWLHSSGSGGGGGSDVNEEDDNGVHAPWENGHELWSSPFLPTDQYPVAYKVTLEPNLDDFTFMGSVNISLTLTAARDYIVLNCFGLDIDSFTLVDDGGRAFSGSFEFFEAMEYIYFNIKDGLSKGNYLLSISFRGELKDDLRGFYRSSYATSHGEQFMATTQFQPSDARRAFPCFDQPDMKASFEITLVIPSSLMALSNAPISETVPLGEGKQLVRFDPTPPMSTYLVAFVIGDFRYTEVMYTGASGRMMPIRVYAVPGKEHQGEAAVHVANRTIAFYEDFFDYEYALSKLDMIAIPDFALGAMENWGLVTYRETALLLDEATDSASNRQRVATVVTHELAHQWLGNLVTCQWWGDLWLNEGFANFFETESANALFPSWGMRDQFVTDDQQRAFETDALESSHPVHSDVTTAEDISEIFDSITYSKGGSVVRMISDYMGMDLFREALRYHVKTHQFSNSNTAQLFDSFSHVLGFDSSAIFGKWILEAGFPLVQVERVRGKLQLSQERMLLHPSSEQSGAWWIPIRWSVYRQNGPEETGLFEWDDPNHNEFDVSRDGVVKLNTDQAGFYRTLYSTDMLDDLANALSDGAIGRATDRAGVLNDALVLARSGRVETTRALELCNGLWRETSLVVWESVLRELGSMNILMSNEICYGDFHRFMRDIVDEAVDYVGWGDDDDDSHQRSLLRSSILHAAVAHGHHNAVFKAEDVFWQSINSRTPVDGNVRAAAYRAGVESGEAGFFALEQAYMRSNNAAEKKSMLAAFGHAREAHLIKHTLEMAIDQSVVRLQDRNTIFAGAAANPLGRDLVWDFVREHWSELNEGGFGLSSLISLSTRGFSDEFHRSEVSSFFEANPPTGGGRTVQLAVEGIDANIEWVANNSESVCLWLRSRSSS